MLTKQPFDKELEVNKDQDNRLTYKSQFGDYGLNIDPSDWTNIYKLADKLGQYEDIGTVEQFKLLVAQDNAKPIPRYSPPSNWCGEEAIE